MAHIHTKPGEIDFTVDVFIVYKNKVLLRLHEKYAMWLSVGGHIETNESPEDAAKREVMEEVGLSVHLYSGHEGSQPQLSEKEQNVIPPLHINIHEINENHRHCSLVYYARTGTDHITEPENEKSGGCMWLTKEELLQATNVSPRIRFYALEALSLLAKE
jgi:8-oxo-dGTP pyrophosphatase MutT (NUDIX family)